MVKKIVKKTVTKTIDEDGNKKTVVKEHAPKVHRKTESSESKEKKMTAREREELLIENFVGLQHAMTNMSIKFGSLSDNMSKLLQVFEEAAKGFVVGAKGDDKDMLVKLDSLLDQNKTIAKGLVLMEEKVKTRVERSEDVKKMTTEARRSREDVSPRPAMRPSPEGRVAHPPIRPKPLPRI